MIDNVSQATLDVIEAIKKSKTIKFTYGSSDESRKIKPTGFYGDFNGFEGTYYDSDEKEFRRFSFDRVTEWYGITNEYRIIIELDVNEYPSEEDVRKHMYKVLKEDEQILYSVKQVIT